MDHTAEAKNAIDLAFRCQHTEMCACTSTYIHARAHTQTHIHTHAHMSTPTHPTHTHTHACTHIKTHTLPYSHIQAHAQTLAPPGSKRTRSCTSTDAMSNQADPATIYKTHSPFTAEPYRGHLLQQASWCNCSPHSQLFKLSLRTEYNIFFFLVFSSSVWIACWWQLLSRAEHAVRMKGNYL